MGYKGDHRSDTHMDPATHVERVKIMLKILLAEDNSINQKMASHILENQGHCVKVANHGRAVLDLLETESFDLILMDLQMPVMDGVAATQRIRQSDSHYSAIPIVAMTAHAMKGDREKCIEAGMDDYIPKPVDPRKLTDLFNKMKKFSVKAIPREQKEKPETGRDPVLMSAPMDLDSALKRANGKKAFVKKLLDYLVSSMPERFEQIAASIEQNRPDLLVHLAHGLKGAAATLSVNPITDAALRLEMMGRDKDLSKCRLALDDIKDAVSRLEAFMERTDWSS